MVKTNLGRGARRLLALFRRPVTLFRRFLVGDIQQRIDHGQRTMEKLDGALRSLVGTLGAFRSDANCHTFDLAAKIDSTLRV